MKTHFILTFLIAIMTFCSCDKNESETEKGYGYVLFYTNAQFLLNCGEFDVNIFINGSNKGSINQAFLPIDEIPECEVNDTNRTLKIKLETGDYDYSADFYCSNNKQWDGDFTIKKDSCSIIFLDLNQIQN